MNWITKLFPKDEVFDIEGMSMDKYRNTLLQVDKSKSGKCYIPDGIQFIQEKALSDCIMLSDVYLPDSILQIQSYAFKGCTGLKSINIPPKVHYLHNGTFEGCVNLKELYVQCITPPICIDDVVEYFPSNSEMKLCINHSKVKESSSCFAGIDMNQCILYIPKGSYELYSQSEIWRQFKIIRQS